jgi:hypothetical protein
MKTKNRYRSQRAIESRLRAEVARETPDVKNRVMAAAYGHEARDVSEMRRIHRRQVMKYAVSFVLVAAVLCGALTIPKAFLPSAESVKRPTTQTKTSSQQRRPSSQNNAGGTLAQQNPFVLKAYAAETSSEVRHSIASKPNEKFGLSVMRPVDIYGKKLTNSFYEETGASYYRDFNILREDGDNLVFAAYIGFNLKCVGQHIKSVSYRTDRGQFARIKPITEQEFRHIGETIPYAVKRIRESARKDPQGTAPNYVPNMNYGDGKSIEVPNIGITDDWYGYLPVGTSYMLRYADQDNSSIQYACRVTKTISKKECEEADKTDIRKVPHDIIKAVDGTVVTVTATYEDGSTASKQCVLTLDTDSWSYRAVEK